MRISLRAGEKIYLNGAVIAVDRKVSLELLNDATFLLETHVMQAHEATTPLRQLYFVLQLLLMDPAGAETTRREALAMFSKLDEAFDDLSIVGRLRRVRHALDHGKLFEALKTLRALFPEEDALIGSGPRDRKERMTA
mgnify:CR=1 FL=1